MATETTTSPSGEGVALCACGCGKPTAIATKTRRLQGSVKGRPNRYIHGHGGSAALVRHGAARGSKTPEYRTWRSMRNRCMNPADRTFKDYGGRGITVCERWAIFDNFLADMGSRPAGRSLDRVNNDEGYTPDNCRWATPKEQANNRRKARRNK